MKTEKVSWLAGRVLILFFVSISLYGLAIPAGYKLFIDLNQNTQSFSFLGVIFALLIITYIVLTALSKRPLFSRSGFFILLLVFAFFRIAWFTFLSPDAFNDFGIYWAHAQNFAHEPSLIAFDNFYKCRSLPYFFVLSYIFGDNGYSYAVGNSIIIFFASITLLFICGRLFGRKISQAAVLFANFAPEVTAASGVPSHDIAGLFYLIILFWGTFLWSKSLELERIWSYLILNVCGILLISGSILILEFQRFPQSFLLIFIALLLTLTVFYRAFFLQNLGKPSLFKIVGSIALLILVLAVFLGKTQPYYDQCINKRWKALNQISFAHSHTTGSWAYKNFRVRPVVGRNYEGQKLAKISRALLLADWADQPLHRIESYKTKAHRLFSIGVARFYFYDRDGDLWGNRLVKSIMGGYSSVSLVYKVVLMFLVLIGTLSIPFYLLVFFKELAHRFIEFCFPVLFLGIFALALLLVGEVQARYLFPIYFLGLPIMFIPLDLCFQRNKLFDKRKNLMKAFGSSLLIILLAFLIPLSFYFGGSSFINNLYTLGKGRIINLEKNKFKTSGEHIPLNKVKLDERNFLNKGTFGPYENWLVSESNASYQFQICGLPKNSKNSVYVGSAVFPILDEVKKNKVVHESDLKNCSVKINDTEASCLKDSGMIHFEDIASDAQGCFILEHNMNQLNTSTNFASWIGLAHIKSYPNVY